MQTPNQVMKAMVEADEGLRLLHFRTTAVRINFLEGDIAVSGFKFLDK
jgi:hypothetical protein